MNERGRMAKGERKFDIQERTFELAVRVAKLVNQLRRTVAGVEIGKQVVRSATAVGANEEEAELNGHSECGLFIGN